MLIRRMDLLDIDKIVALEQELFSSPWDKEAFYYELEKNAFSTILVLEDELEIIGYIGMWLLGDQTQITTLGIKKAYQGSGYAKKLMDKCEEITKTMGYANINLEVRISNQKAIKLYEKCGFKIVAIRKNYYQDNHEDAYLMIKEMEV
ncbi:ribosomal protein S18-alanine N-acetyltransferase [Thomasclavelia saccharogumia]|uniref:ribosomal protein S18-alanine N-acetyltransferase n=1 Tax=Thomasclavelia saccharogumia TaxID=341225 RepID=UPI00047E3A44|nr:ribosomal protein S18-alanine N-acetyltransferase [Thomasclavelia saccharogumia]